MFKIKPYIKLFIVLIIAIIVRFNGILWDQGLHLHPDERMIIMVADSIHFFDKLNPHFFSYGSLPIYLLKGISQIVGLFNPFAPTYDGMLYVGRFLSIGFDIITIFLIYKISTILLNSKKIGIFAALFYSVAFFPIQNTHFYTVDTLFTMLTTLLIYVLLNFFTNRRSSKSNHNSMVEWLNGSIVIGIVFAAMMATKFTAIIFFPIIILVFIININKRSISQFFNILILFLIFIFSFLLFNFLFMPYAFLDFTTFIKDISQQLIMNSNPYVFPYTLQYVGTTPYLYYLKNIFFWGMGPMISILSLVGLYQIFKIKYQKYILNIKMKRYFIFNSHILFFLFYILYFLVIGHSAVKFMRYMLPIYPFLAIMAGYGLYIIKNSKLKIQNFNIISVFIFSFLLFTLLWSIMFLNIYSFPHTRISATDWILKNIPQGSTIAVEHWDDRLPLYGGENYQTKELTLYDYPDDEQKWNRIDDILKTSQYIIVASNRLYIPLQKLSNCTKYKRCYLKTINYYQKLFSGKIGYDKVAEFSSFPKLVIGNWKLVIDDSSSDESFSVYDHPKIMIFKRTD